MQNVEDLKASLGELSRSDVQDIFYFLVKNKKLSVHDIYSMLGAALSPSQDVSEHRCTVLDMSGDDRVCNALQVADDKDEFFVTYPANRWVDLF